MRNMELSQTNEDTQYINSKYCLKSFYTSVSMTHVLVSAPK